MFGDIKKLNLIYTKNGKEYRKIGKRETIEEGAMMTYDGGELMPIMNHDNNTVGDIPAAFSDKREFYNLILK